ncbi:hypothetical protein K440DRAFT_639031 [Wilcoxina mikolae CBS 423.85]|nr:hypothetical protein K440DRAFT_639031 [Wilcoxina mikolae CBS 423.85]
MAQITSSPAAYREDKFIVGVDFGTLYTQHLMLIGWVSNIVLRLTSVMFVHTSRPNDVMAVDTWPYCGEKPVSQVPSLLRYTDPRTRQYTWGYDVINPYTRSNLEPLQFFNTWGSKEVKPRKYQEEPLRCFKLWIYEEHAAYIYRKIGQQLVPPGRESDANKRERDSDILQQIFGRRDFFRSCDVSMFDIEIKYLPAIRIAQRTFRCIEVLDLTPVEVVADFLSAIKKTALDHIEKSDCTRHIDIRGSKIEYLLIVPTNVCDLERCLTIQVASEAGFGRHGVDFDLIGESEAVALYWLKSVHDTHNSLNVEDSFLHCDAREGIVGVSHSTDRMMSCWEKGIKFEFGMKDSDQEYVVDVPEVPDNLDMNIEDGIHTMESDEVKKIFDPVVDRMISLLKQCVRESDDDISAIVLYGESVSKCRYLQKRLESVDYGTGKSITVHSVNESTAAVTNTQLTQS